MTAKGKNAKGIRRKGAKVNGGESVPASLPPSLPSLASVKNQAPEILIKTNPLDFLLPYQRKIVDDHGRFKYCLQARQTGKDFASGAEGIVDCMLAEARGEKTTWVIAAPSERQSFESLAKWKEWAEAFKFTIAAEKIERESGSESLLKSAEIQFPGGSRVIAVPGKPDTVRGYSANILLTEFAFFEDPDRTWRAILPSITNPLRGGAKKCRLITTPNGVGNKAHELWVNNYQVAGSKWSCHHVDIYEAVKAGLPVDIEELKAALNDPEGWAQEFELNFLDAATVLLPYEIIAPCENPNAIEIAPHGFWFSPLTSSHSPISLGIDFGRKRDLTVCWALENIANSYRLTKEVLCLAKMSTPDQVTALRPRLARARRACLDYTGPGVGLGDYLVKEFGEYNPEKHLYGKIELVTFGNANKVDTYSKLRMAFEAKTLGIPGSRVIREDLHSVNRVALAGGGVTYRAGHTEAGHADRCTALALAVRADSQGGGPFRYVAVKPQSHRQSGARDPRRSRRGVCV